MRSTLLILAIAALASTPLRADEVAPVAAPAAPAAIKHQTVCPVMGGKINKKQFIDVEGKRIYVCCPGCFGPIKKDPAAYIKKMEAAGITPEATPKPTTHKPSKR